MAHFLAMKKNINQDKNFFVKALNIDILNKFVMRKRV